MSFLRDITHRNGQGSGKKFWYSVACLAATVCLLWIAYRDTMEDYAFICLFLAYLLTVGGFEVILKMTQMVVDIKSGHSSTTVAQTTTKENTSAVPTG